MKRKWDFPSFAPGTLTSEDIRAVRVRVDRNPWQVVISINLKASIRNGGLPRDWLTRHLALAFRDPSDAADFRLLGGNGEESTVTIRADYREGMLRQFRSRAPLVFKGLKHAEDGDELNSFDIEAYEFFEGSPTVGRTRRRDGVPF